jgi:hypothetical protein
MSKVILIVSDAMRYDAAVNGMGYFGHLVERQLASLYKVIGELPSLSRPMYETIHTGVPVSVHGVVANSVIRKSTQPNIFQLATESGKSTAAAAYFWVSELYNRAPYNVIDDREVDDPGLWIQHGRFYTQDEYADLEVFHSAAGLVRKFLPDYLLVTPWEWMSWGKPSGAIRANTATGLSGKMPGWRPWSENGLRRATPSSSLEIMASTLIRCTAALPPKCEKCLYTSSTQSCRAKATPARSFRSCKLPQPCASCWGSRFPSR